MTTEMQPAEEVNYLVADHDVIPAARQKYEHIVQNQQLPQFDRATRTRTFCIVGLVASFLGSSTAFIAGGILYTRQEAIYDSYTETYLQTPLGFTSTTTKEVVSLFLNFYITACTEALGFIHATSLCWVLYHEERLKYNSNLRLFTSSKKCYANGRAANLLWFVSLAFSYASISQFMLPNLSSLVDDEFPHRFIFTASPLFILGSSLLCQCLLAIWCLVPSKRRKILSWSSSRVNTTLAYRRSQGNWHGSLRVAMPRSQQHSLYSLVPNTSRILIGIWLLIPVIVLWGLLIWFLAIKDDGQRDTSFDPLSETGGFYPANLGPNSGHAVNTLIIGVMQMFYTLSLHAAEQIVNASRDEAQWRKAARLDRGVAISVNSVMAAITSWKTGFLLILKPVGHWIFGLSCISFWNGWLAFHPVPIFCLSGLALLLCAFVTSLSFWRPAGPQPSTYGHLGLLATFIDDWGAEGLGKLYWGDKGYSATAAHEAVRIAGTSDSCRNVRPIDMQQPYYGLEVELTAVE